jgi:hypothetical protein
MFPSTSHYCSAFGNSNHPQLIILLIIISKRSFLPLILELYRKLDAVLPEFIENNKGFAKVVTV